MTLMPDEIERALSSWSETTGGVARLINHSENQTFLVQTPAQNQYVLRVHRPRYQSVQGIGSEIAWLEAISQDTSLKVPQLVKGRDGEMLQSFATSGGERLAVLFQFIPGREPLISENLEDVFAALGGYAATLHQHVIGWQRPPSFGRPAWSAAAILAPSGLWGNWREAPGVGESEREELERLAIMLEQELDAYGTAADRYGLIHADMRLGNLLVGQGPLALLDFDDCGFCWFAYDFAAAISFHETHPSVPALKRAWLDAYRSVRPFPAEDEAMLDTLVMLRRMALLAWIGSHGETNLAREHAPGFVDGTVDLAQRYLRGGIWR